jgi:hypothetical protein
VDARERWLTADSRSRIVVDRNVYTFKKLKILSGRALAASLYMVFTAKAKAAVSLKAMVNMVAKHDVSDGAEAYVVDAMKCTVLLLLLHH